MEPCFYMESIHVFYAVGTAFAITLHILTLIFEASLSIPTFFYLIGSVLLFAMPWIAAGFKLIWANIFFSFGKELVEKINKSKLNDSGIKSSIRNNF